MIFFKKSKKKYHWYPYKAMVKSAMRNPRSIVSISQDLSLRIFKAQGFKTGRKSTNFDTLRVYPQSLEGSLKITKETWVNITSTDKFGHEESKI